MSKLRCRPGDLARIIYSKHPTLIGRIVYVEAFNGEVGKWEVLLLGQPHFSFGQKTGRPMIGNDLFARDSSLVPLRGEEPEDTESTPVEEVCHV
jgi:hypothetical protein